MRKQSRISATTSETSEEKLDRIESHGRELPDEALDPARLVLEDRAFDRIAELVASPPAPTGALGELMRGRGD